MVKLVDALDSKSSSARSVGSSPTRGTNQLSLNGNQMDSIQRLSRKARKTTRRRMVSHSCLKVKVTTISGFKLRIYRERQRRRLIPYFVTMEPVSLAAKKTTNSKLVRDYTGWRNVAEALRDKRKQTKRFLKPKINYWYRLCVLVTRRKS